jgi:hypothetical protein
MTSYERPSECPSTDEWIKKKYSTYAQWNTIYPLKVGNPVIVTAWKEVIMLMK